MQGKRVTSSWFEPLNSEGFSGIDEHLSSLLSEKWIPKDAVVVTSEKGSMTMEFIPLAYHSAE